MSHRTMPSLLGIACILCLLACDKSSPTEPEPKPKAWDCAVDKSALPHFSKTIGCQDDFTALASPPLDASIPGAVSLKSVVDLADSGKLYFQNSKEYKIHWEFTSANLSGNGKPIVPVLSSYNQTEYYSPNRRFILGSVTRYEGPGIWAYEIAPYDNASSAMILTAFRKIAAACYCGDSLYFHPTSLAVAAEAKKLPSDVHVISTDSLYEGIEYQPLNYGTSMGRLVFTTAKKLESEYVGFRDIVVLDDVPNDISVVSGIITQVFQTPLSHINVLSQNRGTPNMGLRGAQSDSTLKALKGKWVKLVVGASAYTVSEVTQAEADAWWDAHKPAAVGVPNMDLDTKEMRNVEDILDLDPSNLGDGARLGAALKKAIPAYGGKASHFSAFPHMDSTKISFPKAFAIPVYHYWHFMEMNGFNDTVTQMLADEKFKGDPAERDKRLKALRTAMKAAPVDPDFEAELMARIADRFPGINRIRFRSSTNAEDLDGFTGAGLYDSKTGDLTDASDPILGAVREVWATVWLFRAFEERSYRNIDHKAVGMALLVHNAHSDEEANGVAITANPFDASGLEPGFYINAQLGEEPVVSPTAGVTPDEFIYHYDMPGQPIVMISNSTLVPKGSTVLTAAQTYALGSALKEIHRFFQPLYGKDPSRWYAMDTEFKLDQPSGADRNGKPIIIMKQARPYPGFGKE
ncbi:MAG: PEP/pyruvate-binding domain-containing protein [Fibrobacteria bacterium]